MTEQLLFDIEPEFFFCIDDAKRHLRQLNQVTRSAVLDSYLAGFTNSESMSDYYQFFRLWLSRSAFSNFMAERKNIAADRCLGILHTVSDIMVTNGYLPLKLNGRDLECLLTERRLSLLRLLMMEWLCGTMNADMLSAHPPLYGQICSVLNSSELSPIVTKLESETSEPGLVSINGKLLFSELTSTPRHLSPESF